MSVNEVISIMQKMFSHHVNALSMDYAIDGGSIVDATCLRGKLALHEAGVIELQPQKSQDNDTKMATIWAISIWTICQPKP